MKYTKHGKSDAWYCAVFLSLLCLAVFSGCPETGGNEDLKDVKDQGSGEKTPSGLSVETEALIKQDFKSQSWGNDYSYDTCYYYGTYDGYEIIAFERNNATKQEDLNCYWFLFRFTGRETTIFAWKENDKGDILTIQSAYFNGSLKEASVLSIYEQHRNMFPLLYPEAESGLLPVMDPVTEWRIAQDIIDDVYCYYGNYNGYEIIAIEDVRPPSWRSSNEAVAGFILNFLNSRSGIVAWKKGSEISAYSLQDAYEKGFLLLDDVRSIYELHYEMFPDIEKPSPVIYTVRKVPHPNCEFTISPETGITGTIITLSDVNPVDGFFVEGWISSVKIDFEEDKSTWIFAMPSANFSITPDMSWGLEMFPVLDKETLSLLREYYPDGFEFYYGTYNGCVVLYRSEPSIQVPKSVPLAGFQFNFPDANVFRAWKQNEETGSGRFYEVKEAYDLGFLKEDDVRNMHELHERYWNLPSHEQDKLKF